MSITPLKHHSPADGRERIERLVAAASHVVLGKPEALRLAITCLLAGGHLLLEDLPGVGKTTLAQVLARLLGMSFHRVQFTSDLLPADILGVSIYDRDANSFRFHRGPIFTHILLADEINRATPRAQSALLEAMEERQVTIDGETYGLPAPFFVIATQNPSDQVGTFPLPESQLDRFMLRMSIGYPARGAERELLKGEDRRTLLAQLEPLLEMESLHALQQQAMAIHLAEPVLDYVQNVLAYSRQPGLFLTGLSPRAGLALVRAAKAWALGEGRGHVLPEDVQAVLPSIVGHRLHDAAGELSPETIAARLLRAVAVS